jgi:hypothetical protein
MQAIQLYGSKVIHLQFDNSWDMCDGLMRFQEHYESPKFRGLIFTRDEFEKWYKDDTQSTSFNYHYDWSGFNFPSYIVEPFLEGKFDPLTPAEAKILDALRGIKLPYYVIGTSGSLADEDITMKHELAHALFYLDETYKQSCLDIVKDAEQKESKEFNDFTSYLKSIGYCDSVIYDEIQAYSICGGVGMVKRFNSLYSLVNPSLSSLFNKHLALLAIDK